MAEPIEFELTATGADQVKSAFDEVSGSMGGLGSQWSQVSIGLNQAVELFGRIVGAAEDVARAISEFADRAETLAGLANTLGVSIEEAARRTGGMVTNFELMHAASALSARGLSLTEHELANLAVAAERMKDQGLDVSMESLGEAVARGGPRMRMLGIEATTTEGALAELDERFGDVEEGADSSLGAVGRLETAVSNMRDEFHLAVAESGALSEALGRLEEALGFETDGLATTIGRGVSVVLATAADQVSHFSNAIRLLIDGDFAGAIREAQAVGIAGAAADIQRNIQVEGRGIAERASRPAPGPVDRPRRPGGGGDRRDRGAEFDAEQGFEMEVMGSELNPAHGAMAFAEMSQEALDKMAEGLGEAEDGAKDLEAAMKDVAEANREAGVEMQALGEFMGDVSNQMAEAFTALAEGEAFSVGEMLKSLGKQQVAAGIAKIFEGTGMLITLNPGGAAMIATGAAQLAFGMGLGAAGSAGGAPAGAPAPSQRPERDSGSSGGGGRDGGNVIINYHTPVPQEQVGRMQDSAKRAAERRWGRVSA